MQNPKAWMQTLCSDIIARFRKPSKKAVKEILKNIGVVEFDENYPKLEKGLAVLIGRRAKGKDFSEFFTVLSIQLSKKVVKILGDKDKKIMSLREEIIRNRGLIVAEIRNREQMLLKVLAPKIFAIIDVPSYEVLELLHSGEKSYELLARVLNLTKKDLIWRINYFQELGIIKTLHSKNRMLFSLSDTGKTIFEKRRDEFERVIDLVDDKVHQLAIKAVGGNKIMAEKLENWLKNGRGKGHMNVIEKLSKEYGGDPKKVSQAFFGFREMGATHEKHLGVKIFDHSAAGELFLLELEKFHLYNQKIVNHSTASKLSTYQFSEMMLTKKPRKKNGEIVRVYCS